MAAQSVQAGAQTQVGIEFLTEPGWHIYWRNPGDSGEPPRVDWKLGPGVAMSDLQWPTPMRMKNSAGTDYGYQGTTVLLAGMTIPQGVQTGVLNIAGSLHWLACRDICVPQSMELKAPVRVVQETIADPAATALLNAAAAKIPRPLPAACHAQAVSGKESFRFLLDCPQRTIAQAEFFPADVEQIENGAPQPLASKNGRLELRLKKSEYLHAEPERLSGVILLNGHEAYEVSAQIHAGKHQRRAER
jgi:thiol:disulfide interchange protein DsbD